MTIIHFCINSITMLCILIKPRLIMYRKIFSGLANSASMDKEILRPMEYITSQIHSNKLISFRMPEAMNAWLQVPEEKLKEIQDIVLSYLNITLIFDDIQDNSQMRRDIPVAHKIFGVPLALNACIHSLTLVTKRVADFGGLEAVNIFLDQINSIMRGQGADIYWRENLIRPSEEEYKQMSELKSGAAFILPIKLMQLFSEDKTDYTKLLNLMGVHFEIRDDYCNLIQRPMIDGKMTSETFKSIDEHDFCEDFTDGKLSFPILHALQTSEESAPLIYVLKQRTRDYEVKKYCLSIIKKLGSLQYTLSVIRAMDKEIRNEIQHLGGNSKLEAILDDMRL